MKQNLLIILSCFIAAFILYGCNKNDTLTSQEGTNLVDNVSADEGENDTTINDTAIDEKEAEKFVTPTPDAVIEEEHLITVNFTSELLSKAKDGSNPNKDIVIYLPQNYYTSEERYPVVYYFHGYGGSAKEVKNFETKFNMYMKEKTEFIVVGVDGRTLSNSGSFFVNSPITGPWEDYAIYEIIPYIDENFRTIATAESRGVAGYSMGGFAAINLSFLHPDMFSSVLALSPGLLRNDQLGVAMRSWGSIPDFRKAYGRAFAPNTDNDNMCDIPKMEETEEDLVIQEKWLNGFGNLEVKIDTYLSKEQPLKNINLIYGTSDSYSWIPDGCYHFSELLTEKGVEHSINSYMGGHRIPNNFLELYFVPFFSKGLAFEK